MTKNTIIFIVAFVTLFSIPSVRMRAQEPEPKSAQPPPTPKPTPQIEIPAPTVEGIMEAAVKNIARRYNLNEDQAKFTEKMMKTRVTKFLNDHEKDVWPIIRELLSYRLQAPDDPEALKRIGEAARPLAKLAKEEIFKANAEWNSILTEEQKAIHQYDLDEMTKQFDQLDQNLREWAQGNARDKNFFPPPQSTDPSPKRPSKPPEGIPVAGTPAHLPPPARGAPDVGIFDTFVEEFIKDYELDEGQIDSARSILTEYKGKAKDYSESKKDDFVRAFEEQKVAIEKADKDAVAAASEKQKKLLEPFYEFFTQMEIRLKGLLTTAQIDKHAKTKKAPVSKPAEKSPPKPVVKPPAGEKTPPKKPEPAPAEPKKEGDKPADNKPKDGAPVNPDGSAPKNDNG